MVTTEKENLFHQIEQTLQQQGFDIANKDMTRPWGGFFVIREDQAQQFANVYFDGINIDDLKISGKLSPKILVVAPQKRLSWQYHHRRAEIWKVVEGKVGVVVSDTDEEGEVKVLEPGSIITLKQGERHRLVGLSGWGVLSEIWQHTDIRLPSDEEDIVRVQDDYGR
ncbi:phosphoheptose isomerase [Rufibacter sediminis]|uniref:Phosphoheptose isomerase n=1 Tax=Rufibacter sediminis TaxID=2762756 RepID=A0ABR6VPJ4_9BACT|nr:phosphoheptose isomerase [Rufibacter sediminis]MBC3539116.1 phosphoheptose isomerase [Rufibacter sediminis]